MDQIKLVFMLFTFSRNAKGLTWSSSSISNSSCQSSSIVMVWDYTLAAGEAVSQTDWTKSNGAGGFINVADDFGGTLNEATGYGGRLTRIGSTGLQINSAQLSDSGIYYVIVTLAIGASTATATVSVYVSPNASCMPGCDNSESNPKCEIPQACPVKGSVQAVWSVEGVKYINEFTCNLFNSGKTYSACTEGAPVTSCYSGEPLCIERKCRDLRGLFALFALIIVPVIIFIYCAFFRSKDRMSCRSGFSHGKGKNHIGNNKDKTKERSLNAEDVQKELNG